MVHWLQVCVWGTGSWLVRCRLHSPVQVVWPVMRCTCLYLHVLTCTEVLKCTDLYLPVLSWCLPVLTCIDLYWPDLGQIHNFFRLKYICTHEFGKKRVPSDLLGWVNCARQDQFSSENCLNPYQLRHWLKSVIDMHWTVLAGVYLYRSS